METPIPIITTQIIKYDFPRISGKCVKGDIDVYNEKKKLIKCVSTTSNNFNILLSDVQFKAVFIINTGENMTPSKFSRIVVKQRKNRNYEL